MRRKRVRRLTLWAAARSVWSMSGCMERQMAKSMLWSWTSWERIPSATITA
ncbi:hypothetical protein I79_026223 [Cricetulus griseus]|uniref:Uncharacterized protein n=1 Tax=Cricetulus griseus TaxID=10029 RepID=G3IQB2_CRIGR|nr:hypothetical protein I79_026223 [Cricetulus griseus]